jgi:four helix bundle protein
LIFLEFRGGMPRAPHSGVAGARRFQDLVCYQLARELRGVIGALIKLPKLSRDGELCDQLRRAARSATGNVAEGFSCTTHREFARYLDISARSLREIEDRLSEATDSDLLTDTEAAPALNLAKRTSVAIARLTAYLRRTAGPLRQPDA